MENQDRSPQLEVVIKEIAETVQREGSVRAVFGDPLKLDTHSIIPVAAVRINLGGGMGSAKAPAADNLKAKLMPSGFGGGGGINIEAVPLGFIFEREGTVTFNAIESTPADAGLPAKLFAMLESRARR
jgi:uncharacterized spore protein YtfJ